MAAREIPPERWVTFVETFRRNHEGWPIVLEVLRSGTIETIIRNLALTDIEVDLRDDRKHSISISAGEEAGQCMTHLVQNPIRMELYTAEDGAQQALRIDSEEAETTLLRFRATSSRGSHSPTLTRSAPMPAAS
jgi:hypothetical protein